MLILQSLVIAERWLSKISSPDLVDATIATNTTTSLVLEFSLQESIAFLYEKQFL